MKKLADVSRPAMGNFLVGFLLLGWLLVGCFFLFFLPQIEGDCQIVKFGILPLPAAIPFGMHAFLQRISPFGFGIFLAPAIGFLAWHCREWDRRQSVDWATQDPETEQRIREKDTRVRWVAVIALVIIWGFFMMSVKALLFHAQIAIKNTLPVP